MFPPSYSGCALFTQKGWLYFFPDRRGAGLSEGPRPSFGALTGDAYVRAMRKRIDQEREDVLAGFVYLKALGFADLTRVAMMGRSAGAEITLSSASFSPVPLRAIVLQAAAGQELFLAEWARTITAPILLQHGERDDLVPVSIPRRVADALREVGKDVTFLTYAGGHDDLFGPEPAGQWGDDYVSFLTRRLSGAEAVWMCGSEPRSSYASKNMARTDSHRRRSGAT